MPVASATEVPALDKLNKLLKERKAAAEAEFESIVRKAFRGEEIPTDVLERVLKDSGKEQNQLLMAVKKLVSRQTRSDFRKQHPNVQQEVNEIVDQRDELMGRWVDLGEILAAKEAVANKLVNYEGGLLSDCPRFLFKAMSSCNKRITDLEREKRKAPKHGASSIIMEGDSFVQQVAEPREELEARRAAHTAFIQEADVAIASLKGRLAQVRELAMEVDPQPEDLEAIAPEPPKVYCARLKKSI